ncbi:TPA: AlpA family phage regulatory protein [Stenotrophomonas maltophilia]|nr:AlpA family phage regulatory protein [Stenotrophomonas maltophilia]HDS1300795.1 AlpA family phage regulatory protein [Stenotrophomonas maltophilia]HEL3873790.1 AlpA family phage regulatory protein [Stenotrophomonas maltophilia]
MKSAIHFPSLPDDAMLRIRDLLPVIPYSQATCWRRIKEGQFPRPHRLPGRITCWRWGDVRSWLDAQTQGGLK